MTADLRFRVLLLTGATTLVSWSVFAQTPPSFEFILTGEAPAAGLEGRSVDFPVDVSVRASGDSGQTEALSLGLVATGCSIVDLTLDETTLDPAKLSLRHSEFTEQTALLAIVVDETFPDVLPISADTHRLMTLSVRGVLPDAGECAPCRLRFVDGIQGNGSPVRNRVTFDGRSYTPSLDEEEVSICSEPPGPSPAFEYLLTGPDSVEGAPGSTQDFRLEGSVVSNDLGDGDPGLEAISVGLALTGCSAVEISRDTSRLHDSRLLFWNQGVSEGGAFLVAVFDLENGHSLPVSATPTPMFSMLVRGEIPGVGECRTCRARFVDGIQSTGGPVRNLVTWDARGFRPSFGEFEVSLCAPRDVPNPLFRYELGAPAVVKGEAAQERSITVDALLSTEGLEAGMDGAEAWSFSLHSPDAVVTAVRTAGTVSESAEFLVAENSEDAIVLAAILSTSQVASLDPIRSPASFLQFDLLAEIPPSGGCADLRLDIRDGMAVRASPVHNVVTFRGASFRPELRDFTIRLCDRLCDADPMALPSGGIRSEIDLGPGNDSACVVLDTIPGRPLLVDVQSDGASRAELFARMEGPASSDLHDFSAADPFRSRQRLFIRAAADSAFVLVRSPDVSRNSIFQLSAIQPDVSISEFCERRAVRGRSLEGEIEGSGFYADSLEFGLVNAGSGERVIASHTDLVSESLARVTFPIGESSLGLYDLEVRDRAMPSEEASFDVLENATEVVESSVESLSVELVMGEEFRRFTDYLFSLEFSNTGITPLPVPIFQINGPAGSRLWLPGEESYFPGAPAEAATNRVLALGLVDPQSPGTLAPGANGRVDVYFHDRGDGGLHEISVSVLTPNQDDAIPWPQLQVLGTARWTTIWPALRDQLGATWIELGPNLAERSPRLALREQNPSSVLGALRLLVLEALGRPAAAVRGRVVNETGDPLENILVSAADTGGVAACAVTDSTGSFLLAPLENGAVYALDFEGAESEFSALETPLEGDFDELLVVASRSGEQGGAGIAECSQSRDVSGLPIAPLRIPEGACDSQLLSSVEQRLVTVRTTWDPNEKRGREGRGGPRRGRFVDPARNRDFVYTIYFENLPEADGLVWRVEIVDDQLDPSLDWDRVEFLSVRFADTLVDLTQITEIGEGCSPAPTPFSSSPTIRYASDCDCREADECVYNSAPVVNGCRSEDGSVVSAWLPVRVSESAEEVMSIAVNARAESGDSGVDALRWTIEARRFDDFDARLDSADSGFLLPNDACARGEGYVSFSVPAKDEQHEDGKKIRNRGRIRLDNNPEIVTNRWENTVCNSGPPAVPVAVFPPDGAMGIGSRALFLWRSDCRAETHDFLIWRDGDSRPTTVTAASLRESHYRLDLELAAGTLYSWQVVAKNHERTLFSPSPVWSFTTGAEESGNDAPFRRGETNGDGRVDISDAVLVLLYLFGRDEKSGADVPCEDALDVNDDGLIDVSDAIRELGFLFLNGPPPSAPGPQQCGQDSTEDQLPCRWGIEDIERFCR